jgi:hypothetical protein
VKLLSVQMKRETTKVLQFLELKKMAFKCSGISRWLIASVRHLKRHSLVPRKDDFLKLNMQSSHSFMRDARLE